MYPVNIPPVLKTWGIWIVPDIYGELYWKEAQASGNHIF